MHSRLVPLALIFIGAICCSTAVYAQDAVTGMFRLNYTTTELVGEQTARAINKDIRVDADLQWQVYVPDNYDRQRPPGVFVFIDPNGWGGMPDEFRAVFNNHNLIWIGAKANERNPSERNRVWKAMLALPALEFDYVIDFNRLYVGSLGAEASIALSTLMSENQFSGAVFVRGSHYWREGISKAKDVLQRKHYVFITGTNDKARTSIRADYNRYKKDGLSNSKLIYDTNSLGKMPDAQQMDEAIRYLESGRMH